MCHGLDRGDWELVFPRSAWRLDLENLSGVLHMSGSRVVLYVFNVPKATQTFPTGGRPALFDAQVCWEASHGGMRRMREKRASGLRLSQRSLHNAPIFCLLLKLAANGTHQCDSLEILRGLLGPNSQRDAMSLVACAGLWCSVD